MPSKHKRKNDSSVIATPLENADKLNKIAPKTSHQEDIVNSIQKNEITLIVGPAGTGKTFLSLVTAIKLLKQPKLKYKKILIVRPQVPTKKMGFLPGDEREKNAPYMRPILYTLEKIVGPGSLKKMLSEGRIDSMTLEYMRGISIDNTIVLLDEAQNLSKAEILMFLTRLGENSKFVITGDLEQHDLKGEESGLQIAFDRLHHVKGIGMVELEEGDIVRNPLIKKIIERFTAPQNSLEPVTGDLYWKRSEDEDGFEDFEDEDEDGFEDFR